MQKRSGKRSNPSTSWNNVAGYLAYQAIVIVIAKERRFDFAFVTSQNRCLYNFNDGGYPHGDTSVHNVHFRIRSSSANADFRFT